MISKRLFPLFFVVTSVYGQEIIKENVGPNINTPYDETKPLISPDGRTLYFARQNSPDNIKGVKDEQDIYISTKEGEEWNLAENIGEPLNDKYPNGVSAVSPDGNLLLVIGYYNGSSVTEGISISKKTKTGWGFPQGVNIENFKNDGPYVDYYLSNNEEQILLAIQCEGTKGQQDLYVSFRIDEQNWSSPINLGDNINTAGAEFSPFLAADDKTLFFASDGHTGKGSSDIFYAKRIDDSWQNWTEPVNIGEPVNTEGFEAYYSLPASGEFGYFVSDQSGTEGSKDIFRVTIPYEFRPDPVLLVEGKVLNESNYAPIETNIVFSRYPELKEEGVANSSPIKGEYEVILPYGHIYQYIASEEGYMSIFQYEDTRDIDRYTELENNLYLVPIDSGQTIAVHDIVFEENSDILKVESINEINSFAQLFVQYPKIRIKADVHAHDLSAPADNQALSDRRAEKIKQQFVKSGIEEGRIEIEGFGSKSPFDNYDEIDIRPGLDPNNRVELTVIAMNYDIPVIVDQDGDGIIDEEDECPKTPGIAENNGCPQLEEEVQKVFDEALEGIEFESGKDIIRPKSYPILDKVVQVLVDYPEFKLKIAGHTDSAGNDDANLILSNKRAVATREYLINKGIDSSRLDAVGYGETQPVADNTTAEGRKKNRRVEFDLSLE